MNEREPKPDQEQGLYRKYNVERLNDATGKHANCAYFILDLDHDPHSVAALEAYAESCKADFPTLAFDLRHTAAATARKLGVSADSEKAPSTEWVPCSKRLYKGDGLILVGFKDKGKHWTWEGPMREKDTIVQQISHWMEIPEIPHE